MKRTLWVVAALLAVPACGGKSNPGPSVVPSPSPVAAASPSPSPSPVALPSPSPEPTETPGPPPPTTPTPHPSTPPTPEPPPADLIINIVGMSYSPSSASAKVGQKVIWRNNDSAAHTATADNGAFNTGLIGPGGQASVTMTSAGSFPYHCQVHPTMVANLTVTP